MLSILQFLHHLLESATQATLADPYRLVTDNQGLIMRVQDGLTHTGSYPNSTVDPYWGIINEIAQSQMALPI
jgi:hypothetical protein